MSTARKIEISSTLGVSALDVSRIRQDFPILHQEVRGKSLVYLDNAATTQKPQSVINALSEYYEKDNANIHRGVHYLSEIATRAYEDARAKVQKFINAGSPKEIVFVRGTTEAINLVAQSYGSSNMKGGYEVVISHMEHHSNIVPWQLLSEKIGVKLKVAPINDRGEIILEEFEKLLTPKTKLVSLVHISNSLGTINPVKELIHMAHAKGIPVLLDGAQAAPHLKVDVQDLDVDFYAFSGHKLFGPTGIGVLYAKADLLEMMPPYQGGGDMIEKVSFGKTTYNEIPYKFEAGTPNIAGVIGLGTAIDYVENLSLDSIAHYESQLLQYATERLLTLKDLRIIGEAKSKASVISFKIKGIHPHDIGTILDQEGIAIRAGHHCTMPLMERFGVPATARASFSFYNTTQEVDRLVEALEKVEEVFRV